MKRYLVALFFPITLILAQSMALAVEGEPAKGEFKIPEKPQEYKKPATEKEAIDQWDTVQEREKEAKEAEDESAKKFEDALKRRKAEKEHSPEWQKASKEYNEWLSKWYDANESRIDWSKRKDQLSQNELVKQYVKRLGDIYEKPTAPFEQPGWWTKLRKGMQAWIKEQQIDYYSWLGNTEKVKQVRLDLAEIYTQLGTGGLLDKARINKKLSAELDELDKKIGKGLSALEGYAQAIEKGTFSKKNKDMIKNEVKEIIVDLATLKEELGTVGFDDKIDDIISKKIEKAIKDFGITEVEQEQLQKEIDDKILKKGPKFTSKQIEAKIKPVEDDSLKIGDWVTKNPMNFQDSVEYRRFAENLQKLEAIDIDRLDPSDAASLTASISRAYDILKREVFKKSIDPKLTSDERNLLADRFIEVANEYAKRQVQFNEAFERFVEKQARDATKEEIGVKPPLKEGFADEMMKRLKPLLDDLVNDLKETNFAKKLDRREFTKRYESLANRIDSELAINIDTAVVTDETLKAQGKIFYDVFQEIVNTWAKQDQDVLSSPEYIQVIFDIKKRQGKVNKDLQTNHSILTILKEELSGKEPFEIVKEHKQPDNKDEYNKKRAEQKPQFEKQKPNLSANQQFLGDVHFGGLKDPAITKMTSQEEKQFTNNLSKVAKERAKKGEPLSQENWWQKEIPIGPPNGNGSGVPG